VFVLARPRLPAGAFAFSTIRGSAPEASASSPRSSAQMLFLPAWVHPVENLHPRATTCRMKIPPALTPPGSALSGMTFDDAQTLRLWLWLYLRRDRSRLPPRPIRDFQRHRPGARLRPLLYPDNFSLALGPRPKAQLIATLTAPSGDPIEIGLSRVVDLAARARTTLPGLNRTLANDGLRPSPPPSGH
jgi:hypothetical protein